MSRPIVAPLRFSLLTAFAVVAAVVLAEVIAEWLVGKLYLSGTSTSLYVWAGDDPVVESTLLIVAKLLATAARELPSARLGELVMRELKRIDKVAYVRFASVYRSFEDVDEFRQLIRDI